MEEPSHVMDESYEPIESYQPIEPDLADRTQ